MALNEEMGKNEQKLMILFLMQMFLYGLVISEFIYRKDLRDHRLILLLIVMGIILAALVISYITVQRIIQTIREEEKAKSFLRYSKDLEKSLRAKNHDFANHLQVISGLVQIEHYYEVVRYIQNLVNNMRLTKQIIKLKRPDISSLLNAKLSTEEEIEFDIEIRSDLADCNLPPNAATSIIGNLMDNAIYHLKQESQKRLIIKTDEEEGKCIITIGNSGRIPKSLQEKIFQPGFSTKGSTGMGLYIVKKNIETFGGTIELTSSNNLVVFTVKVPENK